MARAVAKLALLAVGVEAARIHKRKHQQTSSQTEDAEQSEAARSTMDMELWTFGAPQATAPALTAPDGDCVPGARVVTITDRLLINQVDNVAVLLGPFGYRHPTTAIHTLDQRNIGRWRPCPGNSPPIGEISISLHNRFTYLDRVLEQRSETTMIDMAAVGMNSSFNPDQDEVKELIGQRGWGLVATAYQEPTILSQFMQHPETLECILTFQGSSRQEDWSDNLNIRKADFCGLEVKVHGGFKDAMQKMVSADDWQQKIKPHLGKCSKLYITGHSLGGASSTLFYACASRPTEGHPDWEMIKFTKESPQRLPYL